MKISNFAAGTKSKLLRSWTPQKPKEKEIFSNDTNITEGIPKHKRNRPSSEEWRQFSAGYQVGYFKQSVAETADGERRNGKWPNSVQGLSFLLPALWCHSLIWKGQNLCCDGVMLLLSFWHKEWILKVPVYVRTKEKFRSLIHWISLNPGR